MALGPLGAPADEPAWPDALWVGGTRCDLARTAPWKAGLITVYRGGLYLPEKPQSVQSLIDGDRPAVLRMVYSYIPIPHGLLADGLKRHFTRALGEDLGGMAPAFSRYMGAYDRSLVVGDVVEVVYQPGVGVHLVLSGKTNVVIPGLSFKQKLFGTWFGPSAPDGAFRRGLLGL